MNTGDLNEDPPANDTTVAAQVTEVAKISQELIYSAPAPSYEPIFGAAMRGRGVKTNLMSHFVFMGPSAEAFGEVLTRSEIALRF